MKKSFLLAVSILSIYFGYGQSISIEDFYLDVPTAKEELVYSDTLDIDAEYSWAVLHKEINSYFKNESNYKVKGSNFTISTEYIRSLRGVAHILKLNLTEYKAYGITIFKRNGDKKHLTDNLSEEDFTSELKQFLRPGDIVRYYYQSNLDYYAQYYTTKYFSDAAPVKHCRFIIQSDKEIIYTGEGRSGMEETTDTTIDGSNLLVFEGRNLPIVRDEIHTASGISMAKVIYHLQFNRSKEWAQREFHNYEMERDVKFRIYYTKKETDEEHLKEYDKIGITKEDDLETKVTKIDDYMKKEYDILSINYANLFGNSRLLNTKFFSFYLDRNFISPKISMQKYLAFFRKAGINYEVMLAENRLRNKIDQDFESSNFFTYTMLYIPVTEKCVSPNSDYFKYGQLPLEVKDNYAIFVKKHRLWCRHCGQFTDQVDGRTRHGHRRDCS